MVVEKKFGEVAEMCPDHDLLAKDCLICAMEINRRSSKQIAITILLAEKDEQLTQAQETIKKLEERINVEIMGGESNNLNVIETLGKRVDELELFVDLIYAWKHKPVEDFAGRIGVPVHALGGSTMDLIRRIALALQE